MAMRGAERSPVEDRPQAILVVDDCLASRKAMRAMIVLGGNVVITEADCATDALRLLSERHFDLVVTDIGLPDMSGTMVASLARTRGMPVVAVSAHARASDVRSNGFVEKPFASVSAFRRVLRESIHGGLAMAAAES